MHIHPGVAQLFAAGHVTLESMFRDNGMLRAAERRLGRVLESQASKKRVSGVAELSLIVGVAIWKGSALPVLLYPVDVTRSEQLGHSSLRFTGKVSLNSALVSRLHAAGVYIDEDRLLDSSNYRSGSPETSAIFAAISNEAKARIADFSIERRIILGCFMEPAALILAETQRIIDRLGNGRAATYCLTHWLATIRPVRLWATCPFPNTARSTPILIPNTRWAMSTTPCGMPRSWPQPATASSSTPLRVTIPLNVPQPSPHDA